jgi:ribosome-binding factor A
MRREEEGAGHRHERVQGLILEELRALMRDDVSDPTLTGVRITAVVLSVDYRHARVHFALTQGGEGRFTVERALVRVTPFLRARLADAVEMKRIPDLRFVFDAVALPNDGDAPCSG